MSEEKTLHLYYKNIVKKITNKKNFKMITQNLDQRQDESDFSDYFLISALLEEIPWKNYFENTETNDQKDILKINFLSKKINLFAENENFIDYFPIVFSQTNCCVLILNDLRKFLKVLKLHQKTEIILATSFANFDQKKEVKNRGLNFLNSLLKEFFVMGKPLDFPKNFIIFLTQFIKLNPFNFKNLKEEIHFFFESSLLPLKESRTRATLTIGEPKIYLGENTSIIDDYSNEYIKYLHMSVSLLSVLKEIGPGCSNSKENILEILKSFPKLDESDLFNSLLMMLKSNYDTIVKNKNKVCNNRNISQITFAFLNNDNFDFDSEVKNSGKKNVKEWHIELFVKTVKSYYKKKLDWVQVFKTYISSKDLLFRNYEDKEFFKRFFLFLTFMRDEIGIHFSSEILYTRWKRAENQCIFLYNILETDNIENSGLKGVLDKRRNLNYDNINVNLNNKLNELSQIWLNKDLLRLLINLSVKCGYYEKTKQLVEKEIKKNFEGVFYLLICLKCSSGNKLMNELLKNTVNTILNSSSTLSELIEIFFQLDRNYLTYILVKVCEGENNFIYLSKILDYSQTIKDFFMPLTETDYHYFSISLSLLAVKREFLRLENWVESRLQSGSLAWVEEFIRYVYKKILIPLESYSNLNKKLIEEVLDKSQITMNSLAIIFENFLLNERHTSHIPEFIMNKISTFYQKIQNYLPELSQVCTNEPEKKANLLLEELYFQNTSMDDFIIKIKALKASNSNRDQELLSCVIINIIDELRFYHNFPEKELYITSDIFGKFIEHSIIDGKVLVVFLKALSDSLENEGKMFNFGYKAIQHFIFRTNLSISPEFYKLLFANQVLRNEKFEMLFKLQKKLKEMKKLNIIPQEYIIDINKRMKKYVEKTKPQELTPLKKSKKKLNIESSKYPEKNLMDFLKNRYKLLIKSLKIEKKKKEKIIFWMNSIEDKKLDLKIQEFQKLLDSVNTILWFSIYFVYKRVPYEPSMQNIYRKLILRSHIKVLYYEVYRQSMKMINQLIDYVMNKEVLLTEEQNISRHCGKWIGYITLVCNRPILLKDFDIKLKIYNAIKEERLSNIIPIVCTTLLMTKKSTFFNSKIPFINALFDILREIMTIQWIPNSIKVYIEVLFNELKIKIKDLHRFNYIGKKKASSNKGNEKNMFIVKSLRDYVKIDLTGLTEKEIEKKSGIDLKQIVAMAIDQSIKDIIRPVLDRSVSNTLETTREIALKDYQGEPDEKKLMAGAEAMITNLTWNLALVTCREPLRSQINQHLNNYLETQTDFNDNTRKNLTLTLSQLNLDIACNIVKKIVINDALESIKKDKIMNTEIELRKKARSKGVYVNQNFEWLKKNLPQDFNPGTAYNDLSSIEIYSSMEDVKGKEILSRGNGAMFVVPVSGKPKQNLEEQKIKELFQMLEKEIENPNNIEKMRKIHGIYSSLSKILQGTKNIENQIFDLAKFLLEKLFFTSKISMEYLKHFSDVLIIYSNINSKLPKQITEWIFKLKDETFKHPLISVFLRRNLLHLKEFDSLYSKVLAEKNIVALNCIVQVLKSLVIEEKIFSIHSFPKILAEITKIGHTEIIDQVSFEVSIFIRNLIDYIENKNKINSLMFRLTNLEPEYKKLFQDVSEYFKELRVDIYKQVCQCLKDWFKAENENEMQVIIKEFDEKIIDKDEKSLIIFFCYLFEISVNKALNIVNLNKIQKFENLDYTYIDAVSKFITILLKSSKDATFFFEKILTSLIIVLTKKHSSESEIEFNQKPFFKILFNIIYDLNRSEYDFKDQLDKFSVVLVQTLHILQPIKYPGFAFSWLQLISSKFLIKTILREDNHEIWNHYTILLVDLMIFYKDVFSIDFVVKEEMKLFYKGTLRILLVLIHDFSDFLSEQSFIILEEIPAHFKQFRNIILSAYPKNLKIQNPFNKPNQKISMKEYQELPHLSPKIEARINSHNLHSILINYIKKSNTSKNEVDEINYILDRFYIIGYKNDIQINVPLLESFVVYVPYFLYSNLNQNQNKNNFDLYIDQSFTLFMKILEWEDYELRNTVINAILNNLRYPNHITYYFISLILIIFTEMKINNLYEQIIKNLLERLIIEKPHPWGILSLVYRILTNKFFEEKKFYKENEKFVDDLVKIAFKYAKINNNME